MWLRTTEREGCCPNQNWFEPDALSLSLCGYSYFFPKSQNFVLTRNCVLERERERGEGGVRKRVGVRNIGDCVWGERERMKRESDIERERGRERGGVREEERERWLTDKLFFFFLFNLI